MCNRHCWGPCLLVQHSHSFVCRGSFCTPCPACSASAWGRADYLEVTVPGAVLSQPPAGVHCQLSSLLPLQETGFRDMPYIASLNCPVQLSPTCPQQGLLITLLVLASSCQHLMSPLPYQGFFEDHLLNQLFVTRPLSQGVCFWDIMCLDCLKHIISFNLCPTLSW